jgi:hypothetical protein
MAQPQAWRDEACAGTQGLTTIRVASDRKIVAKIDELMSKPEG